MKKIFLIYLLLIPILSPAQQVFQREKRDNIWQFGGKKARLDFSFSPVKVIEVNRMIPMDITNASICDTSGNLLLYTNGIAIANATHDTLQNGGRINYGVYTDGWVEAGNVIDQGALILPFPEQEDKYFIFYEKRTWAFEFGANATRVYSLTYAVADMKENAGLGKITDKEVILIEDTLSLGKITSNRHANGRDWWIFVHEFNQDSYYRFLLTPEGVIGKDKIRSGEMIPSGVGQSYFTANGNKYIHFSYARFGESQYISIFDFDRETGELSNDQLVINQDSTAVLAGMAISENSRFLYITSFTHIFQYDLEAEDIEASKVLVAEYDGFYDDMQYGNSWFFLAGLAPDGKIYISPPAGSKHLHIIHHPNKKGIACEVEQHGIELPSWNIYTMPNYPYYGLGPLDGSPSDTLGIDNPPPIADFEYVQDGTEDYKVDFYNATRFSPEATMYTVPDDAYLWRFGDWETSHEKHPVHSYKATGTYRVCLTATNLAGSDTHCDTVVVTRANTEFQDSPLHNTRLFPNPTDGQFYFHYVLDTGAQTTAYLYNIQGRLLQKKKMETGVVSQDWDLRDFPGGVYFLVVKSDNQAKGGILYREKVVVY